MKKKHIALLCVILALLIFGISNLRNKESNDVSNKNDGNSVTVDDLPEDEEERGEEDSVKNSVEDDIVEEEIDSWVEPSIDKVTKHESSTGTEGSATSKDEKEPEDCTSNKTEEDNNDENKKENNEENNGNKKEEKPEWIGGDF